MRRIIQRKITQKPIKTQTKAKGVEKMKSLKLIELMLEAFINQFKQEGFLENQDKQSGIVEGLEMAMNLVKKEIEKLRDK